MADDIDAQEHLEAVNSVIVTCESTANEIETQFAQFDTALGDAESRSTELITELDESSSEIITHTEEFQTELMESITEISERISGFVSVMEGMLEAVESNSEDLFSKLNEMDSAHDEIQGQIEENASHMKEIFESLTNSWVNVAEKLTSLQEQQHNEIDSNIREHSETQASEQEADQSSTVETLEAELNQMIGDTQQHLDNISSDMSDNFIPGIESIVEQDKDMQEQGGSDFSGMRTETLEEMANTLQNLFEGVDGIMGVMKNTVNVTSNVADVTLDAMDQTSIGLNQLVEAVENVISLLGGLSLD